MSQISSINPLSTSSTGKNAFSELTSEEFVKIMFTELTNQDPLKPNDSTQMLEQLSSLRSIQSDLELTNKLEAILTQNQLSTAGSLIGKYVSGLTEGGDRVIGQVVAVARSEDGPLLRLSNNYVIPFANVDIMEAPVKDDDDDTGAPPANPPSTPPSTPPTNQSGGTRGGEAPDGSSGGETAPPG